MAMQIVGAIAAAALLGVAIWLLFFRKEKVKPAQPVVPSPSNPWSEKPGQGAGAEKPHPQGKEYGWEKNADKRPDECPTCGRPFKGKDKKRGSKNGL